MLKSLDSASNFLRAIVSVVITAIVAAAGWIGYDVYYSRERALRERDEKITALSEDLQAKQREIDRLGTALQLLKVDQRVAQLDVLDQQPNPLTNRIMTRFTFVETDAEGRPLEKPREFVIEGDVVYVDALVVSFEDKYVEMGDPLRGTALRLLRRVYGEYQSPNDGFPLDPPGGQPAAYRHGEELSEFEKEIWANFWEYANNPEKAQQAGVRTAQGKASYTRLRPNMRYKLMLRSTGDFTIHPEPAPTSPRL